jgi:hypothetical protein
MHGTNARTPVFGSLKNHRTGVGSHADAEIVYRIFFCRLSHNLTSPYRAAGSLHLEQILISSRSPPSPLHRLCSRRELKVLCCGDPFRVIPTSYYMPGGCGCAGSRCNCQMMKNGRMRVKRFGPDRLTQTSRSRMPTAVEMRTVTQKPLGM